MKHTLRIISAALAAVMLALAVPAVAASVFTDVAETRWSAADIAYAVEKGYMKGTGADAFSPSGAMTRAMVVTVLWRRDGSPAARFDPVFTDVAEGAYYASAVAWAKKAEIVSGTTAATFSPDAKVTREQLAAMLKRYTESHRFIATDIADLGDYSDAGEVSSYAVDAMGWAVKAGIVSGTTATTLSPRGNATREQFAAILRRYDGIRFEVSKAKAKLEALYPLDGDVIDVVSPFARLFMMRFDWGDFDDPDEPERVYNWLTDEDSAYFKENNRVLSDPVSVTFRWSCDDPARIMIFEICENERFRDHAGVTRGPIVDEGGGVYSCRVTNFKTGTRYFWRVRTDFRGTVGPYSFTTAESRLRQIWLDGGSNVRDIGGGLTEDGRRIRQGAIYRGAEVVEESEKDHFLTDLGRRTMGLDLGVRTIVDLQEESVGQNRHTGEWYGVGYVNTPCVQKWGALTAENGAGWTRAILDAVLDLDNYPIYFHCYAGADRTGFVGMMLDLLLGKSMDDVRLDYDFTTLSLFSPRSWYDKNEGDRVQFFADLAAAFPDAATPQEQIEAYVLSLGVPQEKIDAFRAYMILD